jgi:biotin carboxylase
MVHVLFLAPETQPYNLRFVDALKRAGARVTGIGHAPKERLSAPLARLLDGWARARSILDGAEVASLARAIHPPVERIETIDEPAILTAAHVRDALKLPGLSFEKARLCRDKAAMKAALRAHEIPCAASASATDRASVSAFAEREGFPLVLKPREGFGTLDTFRVDDKAALERALDRLKPTPERPIVAEEFVAGHEGFYDTITAGPKIAHAFIGHYYPSCLEALADRAISPRIQCTNRVSAPTYAELHQVAQRVIDALGITDTATHMEWFFGPKGLKVNEIAARPAGESIWDLHAAGNGFDLYASWAEAVLRSKATGTPTRKYATGSVQIRPPRDGEYAGHVGVEVIARTLAGSILESAVPAPGTPTMPLERGWHQNTWFRLRDEDYDRLQEKLEYIARTVKVRVA